MTVAYESRKSTRKAIANAEKHDSISPSVQNTLLNRKQELQKELDLITRLLKKPVLKRVMEATDAKT